MHNYEYMMRHSYTEVSEFMVPNMHFFMFCLIWFYCLYNTYRFLINKEYSFFYNVLYISIAAVYLIVFFYIVNNLYMWIGGYKKALNREIAKRMGIGRNTIAKYREGDPKELSMYGIRQSKLEPFYDFIVQCLNSGWSKSKTVKAIYEKYPNIRELHCCIKEFRNIFKKQN